MTVSGTDRAYTLADIDELRRICRSTVDLESRGSWRESERVEQVESRLRTWMQAGISVLEALAHEDRCRRKREDEDAEFARQRQARIDSCRVHFWVESRHAPDLRECSLCGAVGVATR
jgi:hypothetical protein